MGVPAQPEQQSAPSTPAPQSEPPAPAADGAAPASLFGMQANGDFVAKLGGITGFRILAADIKAMGRKGIDFSKRPQPIPGLKLEKVYVMNERASLKAALAFPSVAEGGFTIKVDKEGTAKFEGEVSRKINVPAVGNPVLKASITEEGLITGSATVNGVDLVPKAFKKATAVGSATLTASAGELTGSGKIDMAYPDLGSASFSFKFDKGGVFTASGLFTVTPPFLNKIEGQFSVDEGKNLIASASVEIASHTSPIPALQLTAGKIDIAYSNGKPSATLSSFAASYRDFGSVAITTATLSQGGKFSGGGTFKLIVPALKEASGTVALNDGKVSGSLTVDAKKFPEGVPVTDGKITATLSEQGKLAFAGSVNATFGKAGTGKVEASYSETGQLNLGVAADITVPGLQPVHVVLAYKEGNIEGEVGVPINSEIVPGLSGNVTVRYKDKLWSGETNLAYSADNGKLSGNILVTVAQKEDGSLALGGTGSVTAQIAPRLSGTLTATILEEGGVDVSGAITVTEPLELFPEKRMDKELFKVQKNIPLWAILVAVIRVRAGIRAGIGPGVFRNIKVEGSYTLGSEEADPSFTISGEMFIPAFVEGYLAFGAGLGLDVLLGELTGGIEAVGTAGLYGAISVVPELSYADGDWGIEGTATMAAGARLKLGLNAWAEVEALWVTVWENEWKLAEHVMPIGPDLALQAHMAYKFGQPGPPELDFKTSDIDSESLIQSAMPEDGPAPSGARDALENKAEWKGALKEQKKPPLPPETAAEAKSAEPVPAAPPKPGKKPGPPAGGAKATGEGANQDPGANPTPGNEPARSQAANDAAKPDTSVQGSVPEDKVPTSGEKRYPGPITLTMLDEPPAPMPRTRAQEQEDIDAAAKMVDLASAVANDSDQLDNYFPRIKARFGLSELGYDGNFQTGFDVVGKINPEFKLGKKETLTGTGIDNDLATGPITNVTLQGSTLGGDQVGLKMTAMPLGPDHPQGTGPSGQDNLMDMLPTDPNVYGPADTRFIRGHLLNDNLGGPGTPNNLFPITAHANSLHHAAIEDSVKKWVNEKRYWVKYTVSIEGDNTLVPAVHGKKAINSTIKASVSVLNTKLEPVSNLTRSVTIESIYKQPATETTTVTEDEDKLAKHKARAVDLAYDDVKLSDRGSSASILSFPAHIEAAIAASYAQGNRRDKIKEALMAYVGFGDARAELLLTVYVALVRRSDKSITSINFDGTGARDPSAAEKASLTYVFNAWGTSITKDLNRKL